MIWTIRSTRKGTIIRSCSWNHLLCHW